MSLRQSDPRCEQCLQLEALAEELERCANRLELKREFSGLKRLQVERQRSSMEEQRAAHFEAARTVSHRNRDQVKKPVTGVRPGGLFLVEPQAK